MLGMPKTRSQQGNRPAAPISFEDAAFDQIYPPAIRVLSRRFWTPVSVARRAAELLRTAGARCVLDIGAGVGKFALVAAATAPELAFVGIEQRVRLVRIARFAASRLKIDNAVFLQGDASSVQWTGFDAVYFFNPLVENLFPAPDRIDDDVELSSERFLRDLLHVERALCTAAVGTFVVTYHGSSTRVPTSYDLSHVERVGSDALKVWTKTRYSDDASFFDDTD